MASYAVDYKGLYERAAERISKLEEVLRKFKRDDEWTYGEGHTERSCEAAALLRPASVGGDKPGGSADKPGGCPREARIGCVKCGQLDDHLDPDTGACYACFDGREPIPNETETITAKGEPAVRVSVKDYQAMRDRIAELERRQETQGAPAVEEAAWAAAVEACLEDVRAEAAYWANRQAEGLFACENIEGRLLKLTPLTGGEDT